jgi:outer membrane protein
LNTKYMLLPALAFLALSAQGQKLAVIDMQGAILTTNDGQKAAVALKAKYDPIQQSLAKRGQDLNAKQQQYQKASATMSDDAKAKAEQEISTLTKALQRDSDDARADSQQDQSKMIQPILQKLEAVMSKYATDNQITMIIDLSTQPNNLLFANQASNITKDVIALYNADSSAPAAAAKPSQPGSATGAGTPAAPRKPSSPATAPAPVKKP